jgi:hypothetical protein
MSSENLDAGWGPSAQAGEPRDKNYILKKLVNRRQLFALTDHAL